MFRKLREPGRERVTILIDGVPCIADPDETVAAVLLRQTEPWSKIALISKTRRAPYCMMGACFECLAEVDGVPSVQTCLKPVVDGMRVVRQTQVRRA